MNVPVREGVKILLLNDQDELLLMKMDDPKTTDISGKYHGPFWFLVGGKIEEGESIQEAAVRELFEETGIKPDEATVGPIVWYGEFQMYLNGVLTHMKQTFLVARTSKREVYLHDPTEFEMRVIKDIRWFSLNGLEKLEEAYYPKSVLKYLPDVIKGKYPVQPISIDL